MLISSIIKKIHSPLNATYMILSFMITTIVGLSLLYFYYTIYRDSTDISSQEVVQQIPKTGSPHTIQPYQFNAKTYHNINNFHAYNNSRPAYQVEGTVRIPILTYHHIDEMPSDPSIRSYYVTPEMFEIQMRYLYKNRYRTIAPKRFLKILSSGKNPKQKSVMITFDDGHLDNYTNAFPVLKKYHFTGVFYIYTDRQFISNKQITEMTKSGMIIESHSASHADLTRISNITSLTREVSQSKEIIEQITGEKVLSMTYPGCATNGNVIYMLINTGYELGFSCGKSIDHYPTNRYVISRVHIFNDFYSFKQRLFGVWEATRYD